MTIENRLRRKLNERKTLVGALVGMPTPSMIEMCGYLGFDWVMLDGEHEPLDAHHVEDFGRAAAAADVALVARVGANRPELISSFADAGADAVLVPHVATVEDARQVVSSLRFPPYGTRGLHGGTRAARFGIGVDPRRYFGEPENGVMAAAMIEDASALGHLDELAAVDGLEIYFVGPSDLSGSLGHPGNPDHPDVVAALTTSLRTLSSRPENAVAFLAHNPQQVATAVANGVRLIHTATTRQVTAALRGYLDGAREAAESMAVGAADGAAR